MANVFTRFMFFTAVAAVLICPSASTAGEQAEARSLALKIATQIRKRVSQWDDWEL